MQVFYEYIFCSGVVHSNFGIFTSYSRQMLQVVGSNKIGDFEGVLAVEEDEDFPNPVEYLKDEVKPEGGAAHRALSFNRGQLHPVVCFFLQATRVVCSVL